MKKKFIALLAVCLSIIALALFLLNNNKVTQSDGLSHYMENDYAKAYEFFSKNSKNNSDDEFHLAMLYMEGKGVDTNVRKAEELLQSAANKKNPLALYNLGVHKMLNELNEMAEKQRGLIYIKEAADLGLGEAQIVYASLLGDDRKKILEYNPTLAKIYAKKAKDNGFIDGQLLYGTALFVEGKIDEAAKELESIYSEDYPYPALILSEIYADNPQKRKQYDIGEWDGFALIVDLSSRVTPRPLSIYGSLNEQSAMALVKKLEVAAKNNSTEARIHLAQLYSEGFLVNQDKQKALAYLEPVIEAKDPKGLYLAYLINRQDNSQYLLDSADQNYLPAIYLLSQIYMNEVLGFGLGYDPHLARQYKEKAAALGKEEAIIDILTDINQYSQQDRWTFSSSDVYDYNTYADYAKQLLLLNPNSSAAHYHLGYAYEKGLSVEKDNDQAFQYISKAYALEPENRTFGFKLADMYLEGVGTEANPKKAVEIYQTLDKFLAQYEYFKDDAKIELVKNYFVYNLQDYITQDQIKEYLLSFADNDSALAKSLMYRLADIYLLEGDQAKAFATYQKHLNESDEAKIAYAKALLQQNNDADKAEAIQQLKAVIASKQKISRKSWETLNDLLFENALDDTEIQTRVARLAATTGEEKFVQYVEQSLDSHPNVAFAYVERKIKIVKENQDDVLLKDLYEKLLKIVDQNYVPAFDLLHYEIDYGQLKKMIQLSDDDIVKLYEKGAMAGSDKMKYELGEFYKDGKYVKKDYKKALSYFQSQKDQTLHWTQSRIRDLQEDINLLEAIQVRVNNNEADGYYDLSKVYQYGRFGEDEDPELADQYMQKAIELGSIQSKIDFLNEMNYSRNEEMRLQNIEQYHQYMLDVATSGDARWQEELGKRYLYGEDIKADREKARYWLEKAYAENTDYYYALREMNAFDKTLRAANESNNANAMYQTGVAYHHGNGVQKDSMKALQWYEKAYQVGKNEQASFQLGHLYSSGIFDESDQMIMVPDWDKAALYYSTVPAKFKDYAQRRLDFYNGSVLPSRKGSVGAILRVEKFYKDQSDTSIYKKLRMQLLQKAMELGSDEAKEKYDQLLKSSD